MSDTVGFVAFGLLLLAMVAAGEAVRARAGWSPDASRRLVHALTGTAVAVAVPFFETPLPLYALAIVFTGVNLVAARRGWFPGMHGIRRPSMGTVTFPLALIFALLTCWTLDPGRTYIIQIAFLVLAISDPLASIAGGIWGQRGRFRIGRGEKSLAGSTAFLLSAWVIVAAGLWLLPVGSLSPVGVILAALGAAATAALAEALGTRGWDNLLVVVAAVCVLAWLHQFPEAVSSLVLALAIAAVFAVAAHRLRFLTVDGALAAAGLAFCVLAFGGLAWAVPAFTFFFLSSLLSKMGRRRKRAAMVLAEKGGTRDAGQVLANGGIAWVLVLAHVFFPGEDMLFWAFAGAMAAAAADTWATELGTLVQGRTYLVSNGERVPPGTSGGVSTYGTLGAAAGAAVIFLSVVPLVAWEDAALRLPIAAALVIGGGLAGAAIDSLAGATVQGVYRDPGTGEITERRPSPEHAPDRGRAWLTNDRVNLACTAVGALVPLTFMMLR